MYVCINTPQYKSRLIFGCLTHRKSVRKFCNHNNAELGLLLSKNDIIEYRYVLPRNGSVPDNERRIVEDLTIWPFGNRNQQPTIRQVNYRTIFQWRNYQSLVSLKDMAILAKKGTIVIVATFFAVVGLFLFSIPLSTMTVDIVSVKRNEKIVTIVPDSARCIGMIAKHEKELTVADDNEISKMGNETRIQFQLNNLRLVFLGDSVMRYQYLDFIYYIHTGQWIQNDDYPNLVAERSFGSWSEFYNITNGAFDGKEKCDCYRTEEFDALSTFETRYYTDTIRNNYIAYYQKFGLLPAHGHWEPEYGFDNSSSTPGTIPTDYTFDNGTLWEYNWVDVILNHIGKLQPRPDFLVLNAGLWDHDLDNETILHEIQAACILLNISSIYKTTTPRDYQGIMVYAYEITACEIFDLCFNLSWTGDCFGSDYYLDDGVHFLANMNQRFNEQLLLLLKHNTTGATT